MAGATARPAVSPVSIRRTPGELLRSVRLARHLTMRDVALASKHLAARFENQEFNISRSHLSDIEERGALPNLYRLCSLSMIYELDLLILASWFLPELAEAADLQTHEIERMLSGFPDNTPKSAQQCTLARICKH